MSTAAQHWCSFAAGAVLGAIVLLGILWAALPEKGEGS